MNTSDAISNLPTTGKVRKRSGSSGSDSGPPRKKFRCEPCKKSFTQHKSLLRHQRENRNHRDETFDTDSFSCDQCHETFSRAHDRERHRREQHQDGKSTCPECGKRIRANIPHNNLNGIQCRKQTGPTDAAATTTAKDTQEDEYLKVELSLPLGIQETAQESVIASLTQQVSKTNISNDPAVQSACLKQQVRAKKPGPLLPCGICGTKFEINDMCKLGEHLQDHFKDLGCNSGKYKCEICEISFTHRADLERHESSAKKGDCGFAFVHKEPCTGHHRPETNRSRDPKSRSDDDRFGFTFRLRCWEQSQLKAFSSSFAQIMKSLQQRRMRRDADHEVDNETVLWSEPVMRHWSSGVTRSIGYPKSAASRLEFLTTCSQNSAQPTVEAMGPTDAPFAPIVLAQSCDTDLQNNEFIADDVETLDLDDFLCEMLCKAAREHDPELAEFAIQCGGDAAILNDYDEHGMTALYYAACFGSYRVAQTLVEAGADVHIPGMIPPLAAAVGQGFLNVAELLIRHGAIGSAAERGLDIIDSALKEPHPRYPTRTASTLDKLRILLDNGASAKYPCGRFALETAARKGDIDVLKTLLDHGANPGHDAPNSYDALAVSIKGDHPDAARLLIRRGSLVGIIHLELAIKYAASLALICILINKCENELDDPLAFLEMRDGWNHPLILAVTLKRCDVVRHLMAKGVRLGPVLAGRSLGSWALFEACWGNQPDIARTLLENGADVTNETFDDVRSRHLWGGDQPTFLSLSSAQGSLHCTKALVENGANLEATTSHGRTALFYAVLLDRPDIVDYLVSFGADVSARDQDGHTLLCRAVVPWLGSSNRIVSRLLKAGAQRDDCAVTSRGEVCAHQSLAIP